MTPKPPASSDGSSLPPRQRPNLGALAKDTTELDLWAFEDAESGAEEPTVPVARPAEPEIPAPRPGGRGKAGRKEGDPEGGDVPHLPVVPAAKPSIKVNISMKRAKDSSPQELTKADADFGDLDSWDEPGIEPVAAEPTEGAEVEEPAPVVVPEPVAEESAAPEPSSEFEPVVRKNAAPVSLRPHLGLSKIERIGLAALVALLLIGAGVIYFNTISRLPKGADLAAANDFPIAGQHVTVDSAESYWRTPVTEGGNADTFRRGTLLLPVVSLGIGKGTGAVRVFFRDGNGELVGDAVTRAVRDGAKLDIAATAGFEDAGMYAGYRTGLGKVWTIEVHEAASENATATAFRKLFEMSIASDRR